MKTEKFNKLVEDIKENLITKTLIKKSEEYTRGKDRLSNFKRMAAIQQCTPEKALIGVWSKHLASILDMVDDVERSQTETVIADISLSVWDEKIGDAINYLILLRALIEERLENKLPEQEQFRCLTIPKS